MKSPVFISNLTGKLENFHAISTNTLSNDFCKAMHQGTARRKKSKKVICVECYSWSLLEGFRKNVATALQRNSDLLSSRYLSKEELPVVKDKQFRFNAHGELINKTHLQNLVDITRHNPDCTFTLWTKKKQLINRFFSGAFMFRRHNPKPSNLILVYSNPYIDDIMYKLPLFFDKTFNNVSPDRFLDEQNCTGQKCKDCLLCYTHNNTTTIVEKVKNYGKKT